MISRRTLGHYAGAVLLLSVTACLWDELAVAQQKPVRVEREYIRPDTPRTLNEMLRRSDAVVALTAQAAAGGDAKYYGNYISVVTANTAVVDEVYYSSKKVPIEAGMTVLVLTPGGRVDRGDFIEHVIVEGAEPWQPGRTYIAAMTWRPELDAWQPSAYYESVFTIGADGALAAMGTGRIAKEANRLGRIGFVEKVKEAAKMLGTVKK